jgi:hypothetical protein
MNMISELLPHIETELQYQVARLDQPRTRLFHEMLTYHLGWTRRNRQKDSSTFGSAIMRFDFAFCSAQRGITGRGGS